jgi:hypothetical protein
MANKYAVLSGLWSDTAVWSDSDGGAGGAAVPADDDAVFISAAVNVQMDTDLRSYTGLRTVTTRGGATPGMLYQKSANGPNLRIGTTKPNVRTDRFSYIAAAAIYQKAAVPAGTALAGADIPEDKYGAWALDIGTDGTIDITPATDNATGYDSSALALAGLPAVAANHVRIGTVTAMKSDGVFDPGTTDLDAANTTVAYANTAGATFNYGHLKIRTAYNLVGTTSTNRGRLLANSDGSWGTTTALPFADKLIIDCQGTSKVDATDLDTNLYDTEPTRKIVRTYGTKYDIDDADVSVANDTLDLGAAPPVAGTPVMITTAAGTLPAPLRENMQYYIRAISGNLCKLATQNADAQIVNLTTTGSGNFTVFTGYAAGSATVNVLDNVTSDTPWTTLTGHNAVVLFNMGPQSYDQQRLTLTTINAGTIVLSAVTDSAQLAGASIALSSRNVQILSNGTTAAQPIVDFTTSTFTGSVFRCEIRNTAGTGTTFYGYGVNAGVSHTFSGMISGCTYGISAGTLHTNSGTISGCSNGLSAGTLHTNSGTISGCSYGISGGTLHTNSGTISGCTNGINAGTLHTNSGTISGCTYGISGGTSHTNSGTISGCTIGISAGTLHTNSGTISGCTSMFRSPIVKNLIIGGSAETVTFYDRNTVGAIYDIAVEDVAGVLNTHKRYASFADILITPCDGTGDAPSVDPDGGNGNCIECSNLQSNIAYEPARLFDYENRRIWATASVSKTYTFKCQTTMSTLGTAGRLVLTASYLSNAVTVVRTEVTDDTGIAERANDADWTQTVAVTINPSQTGWINFRLELKYYEANDELYVWPMPTIS